MIVRDEPLPRIRPPRPPDANWKPDLIVGDGESDRGPLPPPSPDPQSCTATIHRMAAGHRDPISGRATQRARGVVYARRPHGGTVSVVILGIWMASPPRTDVPPAKPSDLTSSPWPESLPRAGKTPVPDWDDSLTRIPQSPKFRSARFIGGNRTIAAAMIDYPHGRSISKRSVLRQ